jgi:TonB family protein
VRTRYLPELPANLEPVKSEMEIWVVVEADGVVRESVLTVSCGNRQIDELYEAAIRNWSFTPALVDGKPVAQQARQVFDLKMSR